MALKALSLQPDRMYATGDNREGLYKVAQFTPNDWSPLAMLEGQRGRFKTQCTQGRVISLYYW